MHRLALDGKSSMKITAGELEQFTARVEDFAARMVALKEKSQDIDKIVDLIIDISDGTKLISLNASVEAARAGNAGLGFSVIAQNVRELASKASSSADEIKRDVNVIQDEFVSFTKFMRDHKNSVEEILMHVKKTEEVMDNIVVSVNEVSGMVKNVAIAAKNQSATSQEMSNMIERISEITQNLNGSVFSIKNQATELLTTSSDLNRKIQWFKTNGKGYSQYHVKVLTEN
jgi:methyl-accepting chemotaxis protein